MRHLAGLPNLPTLGFADGDAKTLIIIDLSNLSYLSKQFWEIRSKARLPL